jgi:hypothetical protein
MPRNASEGVKAIAIFLMTQSDAKMSEVMERTGMKRTLQTLKATFLASPRRDREAMVVPKRKEGSGRPEKISLIF